VFKEFPHKTKHEGYAQAEMPPFKAGAQILRPVPVQAVQRSDKGTGQYRFSLLKGIPQFRHGGCAEKKGACGKGEEYLDAKDKTVPAAGAVKNRKAFGAKTEGTEGKHKAKHDKQGFYPPEKFPRTYAGVQGAAEDQNKRRNFPGREEGRDWGKDKGGNKEKAEQFKAAGQPVHQTCPPAVGKGPKTQRPL
jgi:hypothetical protein